MPKGLVLYYWNPLVRLRANIAAAGCDGIRSACTDSTEGERGEFQGLRQRITENLASYRVEPRVTFKAYGQE